MKLNQNNLFFIHLAHIDFIDGVDRMKQIRLLGVVTQGTFGVEVHVNYDLSICSQRIFFYQKTA
jgi:hypothetical protein